MLKLQSIKLPYITFSIILILSIFYLSGCKVTKSKDISYMEQDSSTNLPEKQLNIFSPKKVTNLKPVFIFVHGGSWNSGKKELYNYFGKRLARKGIVAVNIDYPLSPEYNIKDMSIAVAKSVKWVNEHIEDYGGDPSQIYISGHSAGGHLAALVSLKEEYFEELNIENPIKGAILIDAAGLDMYGFLKKKNYPAGTSYLKTFTNDSEIWKQTSPIYFIEENDPPLLIMMGGKTLPGIISSTDRFLEEYKKTNPNPNYHLQEGKKHIPMILQFFNSNNKAYDWIESFISNNNKD
ncbi:Acetyl esterase/lipase [Marivirga sericea]|uniref:Acetyl esterase/lipase n=1 Tax=Marivirga sericea TaxID=1028 RepID=A0A1X7IK94_9BACT|nr:alpha/beta hydrolase [Marivirga sericea]SMG15376.1 Acetyl esterase/lipase [Marivirga sericea]